MPIDLETMRKTAELARLDLAYGLSEEEAPAALEKLAGEMAGIVGYMDVLSEADTDGVEPLYSPLMEPAGPRQDLPRDSRLTEAILEQAPDHLGTFFAVPKII